MSQKKLIVIMGVSGSGKTTIAQHISQHMPFKYMEADAFHSLESKRHMQNGRPLTDDMRWPWIQNICAAIQKDPEDIVLANSGLKFLHRKCFRELGRVCVFIHLQVPRDILQTRLELRTDHFMPATLLDSQFDDMEEPLPSESVYNVDCRNSLSETLAASLSCVQNVLYKTERNCSEVKICD
ncbi:MAG: gluconokinase [Maricaulaceae bacterium]